MTKREHEEAFPVDCSVQSSKKSHDAAYESEEGPCISILDPQVIGHVCQFLTPRDLARFLCVAQTNVPLANTGVDWSEENFTKDDPERAASLAYQSGALILGLYLEHNLEFLSEPNERCDLSRLRTLVFVGDRGYGPVDLAPLAACPHIRELEISNCDGLMNVPTLADLKHLKHLKIFLIPELRDLAMLRYCLEIEILELEGLPSIPDLIPVGALSHLKALTLDRLVGVKDLWPLGRCEELESLAITKCDKLQGDFVAALSACAKLQKLDIQNMRRAKGIGELRSLKNFKYFRSTDLQIGDDLLALAELPNLRELYCTDCVRPLPPLHLLGAPEMTRLEVLDLSGNRVTTLQPLSSCKDLKEIWLQNVTGLKSLSGLEECEELEEIHAKEARQLSNIMALKGHEGLRVIDLSECVKITNITALGSCEALEKVNISETDVKDLKPLANCPKLFSLWCNHCERIQSLAPLTPEKNPNLTNLEAACPELVDLGNLGRPSLRVADFTGATELRNISSLSEACELRVLNLRDCATVKDLSAVYELPYFRTLNITGCSRIRRVPRELQDREKLTIIGDPNRDPDEEISYRALQKALPSSAPHLLGLCDISDI